MHSIVVLGDVRTHEVEIDPTAGWDKKPDFGPIVDFYGGALFMKAAIEMLLGPENVLPPNKMPDDHDKGTKEKLRVLGYSSTNEDPVGGCSRWRLFPFSVEESSHPRPRLRHISHKSGHLDSVAFPMIDEDLESTLKVTTKTVVEELEAFDKAWPADHSRPLRPDDRTKKGMDTLREKLTGAFENVSYWGGIAETRICPDILVIDDLNEGFRDLRFRISDDNRSTGVGGGSPEQNVAAVLGALFSRMRATQKSAEEHKVPVMEPLILASARQPKSILSDRPDALEGEQTFWGHVWNEPWLRDRTCLILEANDLRDAGYAISSGLSWERSAQDAISEFWRFPELRRLLEFGQVVVCFGITGALHMVKMPGNIWTYNLAFDPSHDDVAWTNRHHDGNVLGSSSVFVATIVEFLSKCCSDHNEHPFLSDYAPSVADSLRTALSRVRYLYDVGYGESGWQEFWNRFNDRKAMILPEYVFTGEQKVPDKSPQYNLLPRNISVSSVPPMVLPIWSIIGQSAQGRYGDVARDIVLYGPQETLNQPPFSCQTLETLLAESLCDELESTLPALLAASPASGTLKDLLSSSGFDWNRAFDNSVYRIYQDESYRVVFGSRSDTQISDFFRKAGSSAWRDVVDTILSVSTARTWKRCRREIIRALTEKSHVLSKVLRVSEPSDVVDESLVAPLVGFPTATAGASRSDWTLFVVDRREIEGFRAIRRLMRQHIQRVQEGKARRPLCIAVFGPPGSGKSTAVKKINASLVNSPTVVLPAFNVAQFKDVEALDTAFDEILKKSKDGKVPIAFFDEFDTSLGDTPLGWLKYFLAPMEDGEFLGKSVTDAILVFAGGTSRTFSEFSLANRSRNDSTWINFSKAKGPDFTSRLRGHLDIVGINPADPDDDLYIIRRAILIRALLTDLQELDPGEKAKIESDMLRAVLHVPTYQHGGRSVRMLLQQCSADDGTIAPSAVPPLHQLDMLVDGKSFMDLLTRAHQ